MKDYLEIYKSEEAQSKKEIEQIVENIFWSSSNSSSRVVVKTQQPA